ncbi:hypothetical protein SUGI_0440830 [Cryptomeria japonica]|nr:hypothetical protein SUGI_0440830 [Cryptomeria japonica]
MDRSLCKAVVEGDSEKVRELVKNNPHILKTVTPLGNTALHVAAGRKDYKLVEVLISLKPCMMLTRNAMQETALHKAAAAGCLEIVELFLNFTSHARCNCSECQHVEGFDLEAGGLNHQDLCRSRNADDQTALHYAARGNYVEIVSLLLKKVMGIALIVNKAGESALFIACEEGCLNVVERLLEKDVRVSDTRLDGRTCLHVAINMDCSEMAFHLLRMRPALAKKEDASGNTPLHGAAIIGHAKLVEELLRISPDMALQKNQDEMAAIHIAALMGYEKIVSCLIDNVPDCIEVLGKDNKNVLHFALEYGNVSVANTLLFNSMDPAFLINHADNDGKTAFHKAAIDRELASKMLSPMAKISTWNLNAVDISGLTALDVIDIKTTFPQNWLYGLPLRGRGAYQKAWTNFLLKTSKPLLEDEPEIFPEVYCDDKKGGVDSLSIIATLVFTVTFAAAFTIPGGVRSDNGVPVRMHAIALQIFTLFDSIAFCSSMLALFTLTFKSRKREVVDLLLFRIVYHRGVLCFSIGSKWIGYDGLGFVQHAVGATILSFITGVYVMVAPKCLWLALTVCAMGAFTYYLYGLMLFTFRRHLISL